MPRYSLSARLNWVPPFTTLLFIYLYYIEMWRYCHFEVNSSQLSVISAVRMGALVSVGILTIDSPLHRLWQSFPRWGTQDVSEGFIFLTTCSSPSPALRELPGMSLPSSSFSTCTIVQPPSRLEGSPPNFGGPARGAFLLSDRVNSDLTVSSISLTCKGELYKSLRRFFSVAPHIS